MTKRTYSQAEYDAATERLPCKHWKGDWVHESREAVYDDSDKPEIEAVLGYCRSCAELQAAYAAGWKDKETGAPYDATKELHIAAILQAARVSAMGAQRDACVTAINKCYRQADGWARQSEVEDAIRNAPLASDLDQKWLEEQQREWFTKGLREARRQIVSIESPEGQQQLAVARLEAYRTAAVEMCPECRRKIPVVKNEHGFWYHNDEPCEAGELLDLAIESQATAREGEVK